MWPVLDANGEPDPFATRIAICGESGDNELPLSQAPGGINTATWKGFIAVYDGNGALRWSHHFFGPAEGVVHCAVTDVSIRVVDGQDVVTYCGISTYGNPQQNLWLTPIQPFVPPTPAEPLRWRAC